VGYERESPFSGDVDVELDESYLGARRVRGERGCDRVTAKRGELEKLRRWSLMLGHKCKGIPLRFLASTG